jgi:DNA gyrase/topoisomerase IV subunit B
MTKESNKEIVVLSEREHILLRPTVYVGSVKSTDEKVPLIRSERLIYEEKPISVGMYKILNEVIDNSVDEAKRMKGKMKSIKISINSKTNSASIKDMGNGFFKGTSINKDSGKTNIETAVSMLRAGSNFNNDEIEETLIGTNGMGVALTNVLSRRFKIVTVNETHYFEKEWIDFESDDSKTIIKKHKGELEKGTEITFEPLVETFGRAKWDQEILKSSIMFKKRLISRDTIIKDLKIDLYWDGKLIDTDGQFFPKESFSLETPIGEVVVWEKYDNSGSISFVNSAMCTGIHQRIINEFINEKLEDTLGHHFYDTFISLNLPPKLVKFGDQNKTRFVTPREEVSPTMKGQILSKLEKFFKTDLYKKILKRVEDRRTEGEVKKLKAEKKKVNLKNSHKYFPPTSRSADSLFIVEGLSAMGSILQKRNPTKEGVYALKGKIKNARSLSDLADNKEILELMQILNLDPHAPNSNCPYQKIVIATDADPDGAHITALLISLFYNWFPWIIERKMLHFLETPLVSTGEKSKTYFYSIQDFKDASAKKRMSSVRYLKGLGSLSLDDWEFVMKNKRITNIIKDKKSGQMLEMAFGKESGPRKIWLSSFNK